MDQICRKKPQSSQISLNYTEILRIGFTRPPPRPGVAGDVKLIARHVEYVMADAQPLRPYFIELRIGERPAPFRGVPVFADDVILKEARIEVGAEPAPTSRRNLPCSEHGKE